jgi:hypothetical protein
MNEQRQTTLRRHGGWTKHGQILQQSTKSKNIYKIGSWFQVNTLRAEYMSQGMNHFEGGWPKDINPAEQDQGPILRNSISAEKFSDKFLPLNFRTNFHAKKQTNVYLIILD